MTEQRILQLMEEISDFVVSPENDEEGAWGFKMTELVEEHGFDAVYEAYQLGVSNGYLSEDALEELEGMRGV